MSEENVYASPKSNPENLQDSNDLRSLATRLSRFGASLIDSVILIALIIPIMYFTSYFDDLDSNNEPDLITEFIYGLVSMVIYIAVNFKFLINNGQTIGKKMLGIKITKSNGTAIDLQTILKRFCFYFGIGLIPMVGQILSLVNVLFIFGKGQRCIHDLVGDTIVVKS